MLRILPLAIALAAAPLPVQAQDGGTASIRKWERSEAMLKVAIRVGDATGARQHLADLGRELEALRAQPWHEERARNFERYRKQVKELSDSSL